MPERGPIRPFTPEQNLIAEGIRVAKSYQEIGRELGISKHTVADKVEKMAMLFDVYQEMADALPPRHIILVYAVYRHRQELVMERAETLARQSAATAQR